MHVNGCKDSVLLDLGRLSMGYGIGLLSYVVPVYIAEITPKNIRGGFTSVHQLMICCGASLTFVIGTVLNWRTLALLGAAPCLMQILGLFCIPESPRWLAKTGRHQEFVSTLHCLRGKDADISEEAYEIQEHIESLQQLPQARMLDLFQRRYLHPVIVQNSTPPLSLLAIVGVGLMVLQQFGGVNGIAFYASSVFVSAGFSSGSTGTVAMAAVQVLNLTTFSAHLLCQS
ncbi:hypothetical protein Taro_001249 [Colocasia esculenta]|uniref:Major facilitator superfamily (MFS) profile domain-containing protein n=1 Tax=Colocasia esculenta TaxID=4460 RepID=A0A843TFC7_COLES|nr:hypothetical protein [Colocasia esculenta]